MLKVKDNSMLRKYNSYMKHLYLSFNIKIILMLMVYLNIKLLNVNAIGFNINDLFKNNIDDGFNTHYANVLTYLEEEESTHSKKTFNFNAMINKILIKKERVDTGEDYVDEIIRYNNRLEYYELLIKLAKSRGYIVTSYIDYLRNYKNTNKRVLILRHDIDVINDATNQMLEIEKRNKVKATYYFRWATYDKTLIDKISRLGFEVGLHYETIANYYNKIKKRKLNAMDLLICRELLKSEIKAFKNKSGVDIETIASHGNPINLQIGLPNNLLLRGEKYSDYGVFSEVYDKRILKNYISTYISDNNILTNEGYSYKANPIEAILANNKVIEFLSHPHHWYYDIYNRADMFIKLEKGNK